MATTQKAREATHRPSMTFSFFLIGYRRLRAYRDTAYVTHRLLFTLAIYFSPSPGSVRASKVSLVAAADYVSRTLGQVQKPRILPGRGLCGCCRRRRHDKKKVVPLPLTVQNALLCRAKRSSVSATNVCPCDSQARWHLVSRL